MRSANRQRELFGKPQGDLLEGLAEPEHTPERMAPVVRPRLAAMLAEARAAIRMPWDPQRAEVKQLVFHNMADWLAADERDELRAAFQREFDRLRSSI